MQHPSPVIPAGLFTATFPAAAINLTSLFYGAPATTAALSNFPGQGNALPQNGRLLSWEITHSTETMDHFAVSLANPDLTLLDHPALQVGAVWRVRFGIHNNLSQANNCVVTNRQGWTTLTINGEMEDERKLTLKQKQQKWTRKRLSDIARVLFIRAGLIPVIDHTKQLLSLVMRGDETAWQFLKRKAKETKLAYAVYARAGKGYFVKQGTHKAPCFFLQAPCGAYLPKTLPYQNPAFPQKTACTLIGNPQLQQGLPNDALQETVRGFDPLAKKAFVVTADSRTSQQTLLAGQPALLHDANKTASPRRGFGVAVETGRALPTAKTSKALAQNEAHSRFASKQLQADTLSCTVLGDASLVPGEVLMLECGAVTVAGRWFVQQIRHLGQGGGYTSELSLIRNAKEPPKKIALKAAVKPVPKRAPVNRKPVALKPKTDRVWVIKDGTLDPKWKTTYE